MNRQTKIIIFLCLIIVAIGIYFAYSTVYQSYKQDIFQQGQLSAIAQIIQKTSQCERVPMNLGEDKTITLIAEECLG